MRGFQLGERVAPAHRPLVSTTMRIQAPDRLQVAIRGTRAEITDRVIGNSFYVNIRQIGISAEDAQLAGRGTGADRWFRLAVPASERSLERMSHRGQLARCMLRPKPAGRIRFVGVSTFQGVATDVVAIDQGRASGQLRLVVAAAPPFLPLQIIRRFPADPKVSARSTRRLVAHDAQAGCGISDTELKKSTGARGQVHLRSVTYTFSGYNAPQGIATPRRADALSPSAADSTTVTG
jgi:hypothetical protein